MTQLRLASLSHCPTLVWLLGLCPVLLASCASMRYTCDSASVSADVEERTGFTLGPPTCAGQVVLPNGASLQDALTEEECVLIALWNNGAFQELLADLGIARGDLVQAGLLPNPEVAYFFPVSEKPLKYVFDMPLESLWLRPIRLAAASRELARVSERVTQAALDLIRDTRQAYADCLQAEGRLQVAEEAVQLRGEIARLAAARFDAGDVGPQEAATGRVDSLQAQQDLTRTRYDVFLAHERLRHMLGVGQDRTPLQLAGTQPPRQAELDAEALTAEALSTRPDVLAAEENLAAASARERLARTSWIRLLGIADATSGRNTGHEFGPALRATLPIFHWNQGALARAQAELEKADRQRQTLGHQVILDVRQAHFRYTQACAELDVLQRQVRPEVDTAIRRAQAAYREGNASYVLALETTRQLLDSRNRQIQLEADLRRAWADLERSVGRHLERAGAEELPQPARAVEDPQP